MMTMVVIIIIIIIITAVTTVSDPLYGLCAKIPRASLTRPVFETFYHQRVSPTQLTPPSELTAHISLE